MSEDPRWQLEAIFVILSRRVLIERSVTWPGTRRARIEVGSTRTAAGVEGWRDLEGRGAGPLLAASDLADELESIARQIRIHIDMGVPR